MGDLPEDVVETVTALTRRARSSEDDERASAARERRERLLAEFDFAARVREDEGRDVLVCYPTDWLDGETVDVERVEDTDRAVEVPLSGPTDADWEAVAAHNRRVVEAVEDEHGEPHATNANALAEYANNHHATTIDRLDETALERFREEYYRRNVWTDEEAEAALAESVAITVETAKSVSDAPPR